ncbi:MAG: inositol monophosphatase family protein [Thermodesulfobacteriota bacterium]
MADKKEQAPEELNGFAIEVIRRSGEEALSYYGKGRFRQKFDEALVTEAELRLREFFQDQLYGRFPEHQVFSTNQEKGEGYTHEGKRYMWIYDALDGVANFQAGIPIWGMSLALLDNYWPLFGLYYMPVTGDLFHARAGGKAFRGNEEIRVSPQMQMDDESLLLVYSRFHHHFRSFFPGKMRDMGCTGAHLCYVAMGRAEAAVVSNETYQGLAASSIIMEAAGGGIYRMDGSLLVLSDYLDGQRIGEPLLAANRETYRQVLESLKETM